MLQYFDYTLDTRLKSHKPIGQTCCEDRPCVTSERPRSRLPRPLRPLPFLPFLPLRPRPLRPLRPLLLLERFPRLLRELFPRLLRELLVRLLRARACMHLRMLLPRFLHLRASFLRRARLMLLRRERLLRAACFERTFVAFLRAPRDNLRAACTLLRAAFAFLPRACACLLRLWRTVRARLTLMECFFMRRACALFFRAFALLRAFCAAFLAILPNLCAARRAFFAFARATRTFFAMRFFLNAIRALACFSANLFAKRRACFFWCLLNCAATFFFFIARFLASSRAVFRARAFCFLNSLAAASFLCFFCLILSFLRYSWRRVLVKCLLRALSLALRLALACLSAKALRIFNILAFSFRLSFTRCFDWRANILFLSAFFFFAFVR